MQNNENEICQDQIIFKIFFATFSSCYRKSVVKLTNSYLSQTPESPVWLMSKNRSAEAKKSLAYLRGCVDTDEVEDEFAELSIYTGCDKAVDLEQYADCGMDQRRLSYVKYLQINTNDVTNG